MSVSTSETNIPKIRKPFSAELPPRVPYLADGDNAGNDASSANSADAKPVFVQNRVIKPVTFPLATKGYVDDNTPAAGKLIVVDSSATGGRKIHVDVEDALKNSGSDAVKDADMIGIKNDKIAKVTVSNGLEKDSSNNLKVKAHTDITVTANGVAANNMRPLPGTNTTVGGTDNRQVNVATANGANLGVVKQGTNVTIKSDGSVNVPTAGGATDPAGVIKSVKNADFVGTDANGQLVARSAPSASGGISEDWQFETLEGQTATKTVGSGIVPTAKSPGFLLMDDGNTRNVRNAINLSTDMPTVGTVYPVGIKKDASNNCQLVVRSSETSSGSFPNWNQITSPDGAMTLSVRNDESPSSQVLAVYSVLKYDTEYTIPVNAYVHLIMTDVGLESTLSEVRVDIKDPSMSEFRDSFTLEGPQTFKSSGSHIVDPYQSIGGTGHYYRMISWHSLPLFFPVKAGTKLKLRMVEGSATRMFNSSGKLEGGWNSLTSGWSKTTVVSGKYNNSDANKNANPVDTIFNTGYIVRGSPVYDEQDYDGKGHNVYYFAQNQLPQIIRCYYLPMI